MLTDLFDLLFYKVIKDSLINSNSVTKMTLWEKTLAAKANNQSLTLRTHTWEGENRFLKTVLLLLYDTPGCALTHTHKNKQVHIIIIKKLRVNS